MKSQWQQQQEQMQRQRDQQMAYAWQQEQKKKRAQRAQRSIQNIQSGGVNIKGVSGSMSVGRDVVGRDKVEQHTYQVDTSVEEKNGCLVFVERAFAFVMALIIGGIVLAVFGVFIGGALGDEGGAAVGVVVGLILALVFAIVTANNVSRHRL